MSREQHPRKRKPGPSMLCGEGPTALDTQPQQQPQDALQDLPPSPQWARRSRRSNRVHFPAGCSKRLISSLAGQHGEAALRAAGLTEKFRQRLEAAPGVRHAAGAACGEEGSDGVLDAAVQAAAEAAAATVAIKLQQHQQLLLRLEQQEWGRDGSSSSMQLAGVDPELLKRVAGYKLQCEALDVLAEHALGYPENSGQNEKQQVARAGSTDAADAALAATAAAAGAMQPPLSATAAAAAAGMDKTAAPPLSAADVMAMVPPVGQQQRSNEATLLQLLLQDRTKGVLQPSSMPIGDLLTPTYLAFFLTNMVTARILHGQDLSVPGQFVSALKRVLKLPGVAAALGTYSMEGLYGTNQSTEGTQGPPAPATESLSAARRAAMAAGSAGQAGMPAGAASPAGQQQATQGLEAGQQAGRQEEQQQQQEEGQGLGVSIGAVGAGDAWASTFIYLRAETRLRCQHYWQEEAEIAALVRNGGPALQQWEERFAARLLQGVSEQHQVPVPDLGGVQQQPGPMAAAVLGSQQQAQQAEGHMQEAALAPAAQQPPQAEQPGELAAVTANRAAAAPAGFPAGQASSASANAVAASPSAAAATALSDPRAVFCCFRGMRMTEEGLRQLLSAVTGDVPGCEVLDLQEVAKSQKQGQQEQQLQGCAISDGGLKDVKQAMQLLRRSCSSHSTVRMEHVSRQFTVTATVPNSSSGTQQQQQQQQEQVKEAILWMLVFVWFAVPAEQHAAFSSWEPLRAAVAAHPAPVG